MLATSTAKAGTAVLRLFATAPTPDKVSGLYQATTELARLLGQGRALDSRALRSAMEAAFGGSDAAGAWAWKDACEAAEAAQVLFLRKFGRATKSRAGSAVALLIVRTIRSASGRGRTGGRRDGSVVLSAWV